MTWTNPYCGVEHLIPLPRGWQITVETWRHWASCWVKPPGTCTGGWAERFDTAEQARAWGEAQARLIGVGIEL
jgi:hypothetical protein